ncbi:hypothetical protein OQA88_8439 [Cercophora sp. LCS_1]
MRLIHTTTYRFREFNDRDAPPYAILSHTWGDEEVTFQDMARGLLTRTSGGKKTAQTCRLASEMGIEYAWVDTCCIDKSSSAELTETINSVFEYYARADICFVYLADLATETSFQHGIGDCRWIRRGWTLQELIAPKKINFYDQNWNFRDAKHERLGRELSAATEIPVGLLLMQVPISQYSIAQRLSWAARRETTRLEDTAYCLLGLLEVNMPLIYGEREMAFQRLQEEVINRTNDLTIFAWNPTPPDLKHEYCTIFASSPAAFHEFRNAKSFPIWGFNNAEFSLTNKGLRMENTLIRTSIVPAGGRDKCPYALLVGGLVEDGCVGRSFASPSKKLGPAFMPASLETFFSLRSKT